MTEGKFSTPNSPTSEMAGLLFIYKMVVFGMIIFKVSVDSEYAPGFPTPKGSKSINLAKVIVGNYEE